VCGDD